MTVVITLSTLSDSDTSTQLLKSPFVSVINVLVLNSDASAVMFSILNVFSVGVNISVVVRKMLLSSGFLSFVTKVVTLFCVTGAFISSMLMIFDSVTTLLIYSVTITSSSLWVNDVVIIPFSSMAEVVNCSIRSPVSLFRNISSLLPSLTKRRSILFVVISGAPAFTLFKYTVIYWWFGSVLAL